MAAILFDTLQLARSLREAGFSEQQATGAAEALARGLSSDLATKSDLDSLKSELRGEIASLRTELRSEIASVRNEVASLKSATAGWIITAVLMNTAATFGIAAALYALLRPH